MHGQTRPACGDEKLSYFATMMREGFLKACILQPKAIIQQKGKKKFLTDIFVFRIFFASISAKSSLNICKA